MFFKNILYKLTPKLTRINFLIDNIKNIIIIIILSKILIYLKKKLIMDKLIIFEIVKLLVVAIFLFMFYIFSWKIISIGRALFEFTVTNSFKLHKQYLNKLLRKLVFKYVFKPFDKAQMQNYLLQKIVPSQEFTNNLIPQDKLDINQNLKN